MKLCFKLLIPPVKSDIIVVYVRALAHIARLERAAARREVP